VTLSDHDDPFCDINTKQEDRLHLEAVEDTVMISIGSTKPTEPLEQRIHAMFELL
jgi:hypothetical protein